MKRRAPALVGFGLAAGSDAHYVWTLWRDTPEGRQMIVSKSYKRRPAAAGAEETR